MPHTPGPAQKPPPRHMAGGCPTGDGEEQPSPGCGDCPQVSPGPSSLVGAGGSPPAGVSGHGAELLAPPGHPLPGRAAVGCAMRWDLATSSEAGWSYSHPTREATTPRLHLSLWISLFPSRSARKKQPGGSHPGGGGGGRAEPGLGEAHAKRVATVAAQLTNPAKNQGQEGHGGASASSMSPSKVSAPAQPQGWGIPPSSMAQPHSHTAASAMPVGPWQSSLCWLHFSWREVGAAQRARFGTGGASVPTLPQGDPSTHHPSKLADRE